MGHESPSNHVKAMLPHEAEIYLVSLGEKPFRARQILQWVYRRGASSYEEMTSLSLPLRSRLARTLPTETLSDSDRTEGADGSLKAAFVTNDGFRIESVLIAKGKHRTACLSTQAGCPLACSFCATGRGGLDRNLRPEEIVDQALKLSRVSGDYRPPTQVVLMGMGEPLLNADAVFRAVRILTHPGTLGLSTGRITLSTAGILPGLERLAAENLRINLALSLNAPTDELRSKLMPVALKNPLHKLLEAFSRVPASRRNPRTLEYVLLGGVNDAETFAAGVARIARRTSAKVNLIPYNAVPGLGFVPPDEPAVERFLRVLVRGGVGATVRRSKGSGIGAACGQLASTAGS